MRNEEYVKNNVVIQKINSYPNSNIDQVVDLIVYLFRMRNNTHLAQNIKNPNPFVCNFKQFIGIEPIDSKNFITMQDLLSDEDKLELKNAYDACIKSGLSHDYIVSFY